MGADFLLVYIPLCNVTVTRDAEMRGLIGDLEEDDLRDGSNAAFEDDVEEMRGRALDCWDEYSSGSLGDARDVTWMTIGGTKYLFSGGMSYGDSPTDSYDYIEFLSQIEPVWRLLKEWSREDVRKKHENDDAIVCPICGSRANLFDKPKDDYDEHSRYRCDSCKNFISIQLDTEV